MLVGVIGVSFDYDGILESSKILKARVHYYCFIQQMIALMRNPFYFI